MRKLTTVLSVAMLSCVLNAQFILPHDLDVGDKLNFAGPTGSSASHKIDVQALASAKAGYTTNGGLGCTVDALVGHYWVTFRRQNATSPHKLAEFWWDSTGKKWDVEIYDQPALSGSAWGIRDMTSGAGATKQYIYGSCERSVTGNKVFAFDVTKTTTNKRRSKGWTAAADWKSNGVATAITNVRALAYHAKRGTMFTASFGSAISEFKKDGTQVQTWSPSKNFGTYGMAYDPLRQTIIAVGQAGSGKGSAVRMVAYEFDPAATNKETGTVFFGADLTIPGTVGGGLSGGAEMRIVKRKVPTSTPGIFNTIDVPELIWMTQATSDTLTCQYGRLQHYPYNASGTAASSNSGGEAGTSGDVPYVNNAGFKITLSGAGTATSALLFISLKTGNIPFAGGTISIDPLPASGFTPLGGFPVAGGSASVPLPIPNSASLAGVNAFMQWAQNNGGLSSAIGFTIQK